MDELADISLVVDSLIVLVQTGGIPPREVLALAGTSRRLRERFMRSDVWRTLFVRKLLPIFEAHQTEDGQHESTDQAIFDWNTLVPQSERNPFLYYYSFLVLAEHLRDGRALLRETHALDRAANDLDRPVRFPALILELSTTVFVKCDLEWTVPTSASIVSMAIGRVLPVGELDRTEWGELLENKDKHLIDFDNWARRRFDWRVELIRSDEVVAEFIRDVLRPKDVAPKAISAIYQLLQLGFNFSVEARDEWKRQGILCSLESCVSSDAALVCARCEVAPYCSRGCQKKDWENHRVECRNKK
jgi:hypothetical protein